MQAADRPTIGEYLAVLGPSLLGLLVGLWAVFAARGATRRAVWDAEPSRGTHDRTLAIRGDLQPRDRWMRTPDERLPGNLEEHTMWMLALDGVPRQDLAYHWIGVRNRAHGFMFDRYARYLGDAWQPGPGFQRDERRQSGMWWMRKPILWGVFQFKAGWRNYYVDGKWYGVPCFTVTRP